MRIGRRNINANKKKGREGRDGGSKERIRKEMEEEKWDEIQREKKKRKKTRVKVRKRGWKEKKEMKNEVVKYS